MRRVIGRGWWPFLASVRAPRNLRARTKGQRRVGTPDGRRFAEGETITVDGTTERCCGRARVMVEAAAGGAFQHLLDWAG